MDREKIRKALDHFENDNFVDAKEIIQQEIKGTRDVFLKNKLGLQKDFNIQQTQDQDQDQNFDDDVDNGDMGDDD